MSFRNRIAFFLSVACVSTGGVVRAADSVMLRPKYAIGDKCYLELDQQITQKIISAQMPGGSMTVNVHRIYGLIQNVKDAAAALTKLEMRFDRVSQKIEAGPMMDVFYDSDDPENEETSSPLAAVLSPMLGMPLNFELDKDNRITYVRGMKDIRAAVAAKAGANPFLRQMTQELTDERAKISYGESRHALYPNKEVKAGDRWQHSFADTIPSIGRVVHDYDCKLERIGDEGGRKVAIVMFEGTVRNAERAGATTQSDDPMTIEGAFKGSATFDIEKGFFSKSVNEGHSKIHSVAGEGDQGGSATKMELTIKSVTTMASEADRLKLKEALQKKAEAAKKAAEERKAARKKAREEQRAKQKAEGKEPKGDQKDEADNGDNGDDDDEDSDDE